MRKVGCVSNQDVVTQSWAQEKQWKLSLAPFKKKKKVKGRKDGKEEKEEKDNYFDKSND